MKVYVITKSCCGEFISVHADKDEADRIAAEGTAQYRNGTTFDVDECEI